MYTQPLLEGEYFHIYNRGVNGEDIFKEQRNYYYFLQQYKRYCSDVLETFAYALLPDHFHFVVAIRSEKEVPSKYNSPPKLFKPFANMFNAYAKAMNKRSELGI